MKNYDWVLILVQYVVVEEEMLVLNNSLVENDLKIVLFEWGLIFKLLFGVIIYFDYCLMLNGKGLYIVFK